MLDWLTGGKKKKATEAMRVHVLELLADRVVDESEWASLDAKEVELGLPTGTALAIFRAEAGAIVESRVHQALVDGELDPNEDADIERLSKALRITLSLAGETEQTFNRARQAWRLANLPLPAISGPLGLLKSEICYAVGSAEALESRSRTKAVSYAGPSVSIPICKGVRYKVGRMDVARETVQYSHSFGTGPLVVTNRRLIFSGDRAITLQLTGILDVEGYNDGVRIVRTNGKPLTIIYGVDRQDIGIILARAWTEARM